MKIVLHKSWGSYHIPNKVLSDISSYCGNEIDSYDDSLSIRTNKFFINYVNNSHDSEYAIVELPEESTDYYINDYDGVETLLYVKEGKIHRA